ncbi:Hypothetical protein HVR_LOCUS70 [uncultured virus]|nr:Hypothetical protein HVR_LOCUS70 [uncultured virus]
MHPEAAANFIFFFRKYVMPLYMDNLCVSFIDIGSYNINGCLRDLIGPIKDGGYISDFTYTGVDQCEGPNVDIVCNCHDLSSLGETKYDVVVSSSCFEHDPLFWRTFKQMVKICKPGGLIYINAPSTGPYHGHPGDCYRFYADSWQALADYVNEKQLQVELIETYIDPNGLWKDSVGIYRKLS